MGKVPRGTRLPEDESLFKEPSNDPNIKPDLDTPAVEGYFRVPAIWVGKKPDSLTVKKFDPQIHHEVVLETTLNSGITVRVQRDGTFLFDFSTWDPAPQIVIPGYRHPGPGIPHRLAIETERAVQAAEEHSLIRAKVMNVQQACLTTSVQLLGQRPAQMGFPIDAQASLKGMAFEDAASYSENAADVHSLARNAANNKYTASPERLLSRPVIELEVVNHSLALLDHILLENDPDLLQMIDSLYAAARSYTERRSGKAVVVAWAVCEQLVSTAWDSLLIDLKRSARMPGTRRRKLVGIDYTASIKIEMLEMMGRIDYDSYLLLSHARKSRNDWAHRLREPKDEEVMKGFLAAQDLLEKIKGIRILLSLSGPGPGIPSWYTWGSQRIKDR